MLRLAVRQSSGIVELDNDLLKMKVRTGAISVAKSFSVRGSMASGPAALYDFGFRFNSSCSTPGTVNYFRDSFSVLLRAQHYSMLTKFGSVSTPRP